MEESKFTSIQLQVIKSIEKSIEKDFAELNNVAEKTEKKISKLMDDIEDAKGVLLANQELLVRNINKGLLALGSYTESPSWIIMGKEYDTKKGIESITEITDFSKESVDCSSSDVIEEKEEPKGVKATEEVVESPRLFKKEEDDEEQRIRNKEVSELPWTELSKEEEEVYKSIFSNKK